MFETTRYEARQRIKGSLALAGLLSVFAFFIIYLFPSLAESSTEIDSLIESFPEAFQEGFGAESFSTIEGFVATELYQFIWILLLGLYMAYTAGGTFAGDIESKRIYLVLATPVSRARLVIEKFLALFTPIIILNLLIPLAVFGGSIAIGYPLDPYFVLAVHVLSIPYHLVCAGIGQVLSVSFSRGNTAQLGGIALIFLLFLIDSVTVGTDFEWLGAFSPARYIDPTEVLLHETVEVGDALLLFAVALLLLLISIIRFQYRDL